MKCRIALAVALLVTAVLVGAARSAEGPDAAGKAPSATGQVYGEWRIRVRPDKGDEYNRLIAQKGLPLFREAGGRMVGWWTTLVGDLYEHLTIWEYDDMAAFEKAVRFLGQEERFAEFVLVRDPLLAGEESRFLKLTAAAVKPRLPEPAAFVVHEIHRVPLGGRDAYLKFIEKEGLALLKKHGFRPAGPWVVAVGNWTEVTYLLGFESLAERERLMADFAAHADGRTYGGKINHFAAQITTRLLIPAPFAAAGDPDAGPQATSSLPHLERVAPGVHAAGFADRYNSANCGWVALSGHTLLVDLPRGVAVGEFLSEVARITGKPARKLALTHLEDGDVPILESFSEQGITQIVASTAAGDVIAAASGKLAPVVRRVQATTAIGDAAVPVDFLPLDQVLGQGAAAVHLPRHQVLFAGPFVVNGPRTRLPGTDTELWVTTLRKLEQLAASRVVPGFGSWGGPEILARQRRFLVELRRQVGYVIAQGRPPEALASEVRIGADYLVWMPYDTPTAEDVEHVYREMTVPAAPYHGRAPQADDPQPHALVLFGDLPHEPGHIEEGLHPVFEATGVAAHFTVDVNALSAENLSKVQLLVILRDGLQRPTMDKESHYEWMTPDQERAVVQFVEGGGALLNLHNSMGLYPADGPYLNLVGGRYIGHGPLERFRVNVVDPDHPVTRGVAAFSVADEQHTPPYDGEKVHLLLENRSDEGKAAAAGWVYEPGRGRLCHLANGHTRESLLHPMYQRLLSNAVNWCLRREAGSAQRGAGSAE